MKDYNLFTEKQMAWISYFVMATIIFACVVAIVGLTRGLIWIGETF